MVIGYVVQHCMLDHHRYKVVVNLGSRSVFWGGLPVHFPCRQSCYGVNHLLACRCVLWCHLGQLMHDTSNNGYASTHFRQVRWLLDGCAFFCSVPSMRATTTLSGAPFATTTVPNLASFTGLRHIGSKHNRCFHLSNRISATSCVIWKKQNCSHPNCISTSTKRIGYAKCWRSMQSAVTLSSSMLVCKHLITRGMVHLCTAAKSAAEFFFFSTSI